MPWYTTLTWSGGILGDIENREAFNVKEPLKAKSEDTFLHGGASSLGGTHWGRMRREDGEAAGDLDKGREGQVEIRSRSHETSR